MTHASIVFLCVGWLAQGRTVSDFSLADPRGTKVTLSELTRQGPVVLIFVGAKCPVSRRYAPKLRELASSYELDVAFVGVSSNAQDSDAEVGRFANEYAIPFPVIKDSGASLATELGIDRTPTAVLIDRNRRICYIGRIDDQFELDFDRPEAMRLDLRIAIEEVLAGAAVSRPTTAVSGCRIGRQPRPDGQWEVTWNNRIAEIFRDTCHRCHRTGKVGPFPLVRYSDVEGWGDSIREAVEARRMPPVHVNTYGRELTIRHALTDEEIQAIAAWVEHGCPEGDSAQAAPSPTYATAWELSRPPDAVLEIDPAGYKVPDEGPPEYRYYIVDPGFVEGAWVRGAQILPGQPQVVRQAAVYVLLPDVSFTPDRFADADIQSNLLSWYGPGTSAVEYPDDTAKYVPPRIRFLFQIFYRPCGRAVEDRTSLGLLFADPSRSYRTVRTLPVLDANLVVPPEERSFAASGEQTITQDYEILNLVPRMNLRGTMFRLSQASEGGAASPLLETPKFSFYWQSDYRFKEPVPLPSGSVVRCEAIYDNSDANPVNPDPKADVVAGSRITDELFVGYLEVVPRRAFVANGSLPSELTDPTQRISLAIGGLAATTLLCLILLWLKPVPAPAATPPTPTDGGVAGTS